MKELELFTEGAWPYIIAIGFVLGCFLFGVIITWMMWAEFKAECRKAAARLARVERRERKFSGD